MRQAPRLVIKSFAKINLYLQVLNKRKDNFHNLHTLFCRLDLADTLIFKKRKDGLIKLICSSGKVPKDRTNLCYRAAALLKQEYKLGYGIQIELKKRIPVGAGLGGGSSDAAGVLLGLNAFWDLNLSKTELVRLAAKLGSDVPFFIYNAKFALGTGRGDKIKPLNSLEGLKLWFILIYPDFKVSTPLIYRKFDAFSRLTMPTGNVKILISELLKKGKAVDASCFFNSLEAVTSTLYPAVKQVKKAFFGMGLDKVMMSGSGPAVFALCDNYGQARNLRNKLRKQYKSWQVFAVSTV
jgi:4-diphosphocytidyl-2-C-methyl-D-erythritol kinase